MSIIFHHIPSSSSSSSSPSSSSSSSSSSSTRNTSDLLRPRFIVSRVSSVKIHRQDCLPFFGVSGNEVMKGIHQYGPIDTGYTTTAPCCGWWQKTKLELPPLILRNWGAILRLWSLLILLFFWVFAIPMSAGFYSESTLEMRLQISSILWLKNSTPPLKRRKKSLWKEWTGNLFPPFRRFSFNFLIFDWFSAVKTLDDFVPGRFRASYDFQVWKIRFGVLGGLPTPSWL